MNTQKYNTESGFISGAVVTSIIFGILTLVFGSIMIWALVNYNDQKNNVDSKIAAEVQLAKDQQEKDDQKAFDEKEKQPLKEFIGPNDLGRVEFKYPKTWSVYIANDGSQGGSYEAYFHPEAVPSTTGQNKYALRVSVLNQNYEQVSQQYAGLVKQGTLRSESITVNGFNGQKFEGNFRTDLEGSVALFKIRDKTLSLATDSPTFRPDFNDKVLKELKFDQ